MHCYPMVKPAPMDKNCGNCGESRRPLCVARTWCRAQARWTEDCACCIGWKKKPIEKPVEIASDGKCKCSVASKCPLGKTGSEPRCTKAELEGRGIPTFQKPQGQPMEKPDIIRCDCNPGSKVCPWMRDMETPGGQAVWVDCGRHKAVTTVKPNMAKWQERRAQ